MFCIKYKYRTKGRGYRDEIYMSYEVWKKTECKVSLSNSSLSYVSVERVGYGRMTSHYTN